ERRHLRQPGFGRRGLFRRTEPRGLAARREKGRWWPAAGNAEGAQGAWSPSRRRRGDGSRRPLWALCESWQGERDAAEGGRPGGRYDGDRAGAPLRQGREGAGTAPRTEQANRQVELTSVPQKKPRVKKSEVRPLPSRE